MKLRAALALLLFVPAFAAPEPALLPASQNLLLATLPVRVTPKREVTVTAPLSGRFTLLVPHSTATLADQTIWGAIDLERLELETRALAQTEALHEAREVIDWRVNQINERTKLEDTLGRLKAERALLDRLEKNPALAELYFRKQSPDEPSTPAPAPSPELNHNFPPSSGGEAAPERIALMRQRIDTETALLETKLSYLGSPRQEELELGVSRLKLEQQTFEHQRRTQLSRLTSPFDAEFRLLLPLKPGADTIEVRAGDDIALLRDLSSIVIQVPVAQPAWRSLPLENLEVRIPSGSSSRPALSARFEDTLLLTRGGREELFYLFAVPAADLAHARPLLGGLLQGELHYVSPTPLRLATKLDLARAAPALLREQGWSALVSSLYPGWRIACIGQHQLALLPPTP